MTTQPITRMQEIKAIWRENQGLYVVAGILIGLMLFPLLDLVINNLNELLVGLVPEAIGIVFTVLILDRVYQNHEEKKYKQQIIQEMASLDNSTALRAAETINSKGWAQDGSLIEARLREANLENIRMDSANLHHSHLVGINLRNGKMYRTDFSRVQMSDSDLRYGRFNISNFENAMASDVDFRDCNLVSCNFQNAGLFGCDFENANLENADLRGAVLIGANLEGAKLGDEYGYSFTVKIDEDTTLPDGYSWQKNTDLTRFTDPYHPDFWRPKPIEWSDIYPEGYNRDEVPFWWVRQSRKS